MKIAGYSRKTSSYVPLYTKLLENFSLSSIMYSLLCEPVDCNIFFCSYDDYTMETKYKNAWIIFISGEPKPVPRIHFIIDCKQKETRFHPLNAGFFYFPFYTLSFIERKKNIPEHLIKSSLNDIHSLIHTKTRFCAYMYRYNIPHRVQLYELLNSYKKIDALGKSKNLNPFYKMDGDPYDDAVEKYKHYKFVLCVENRSIPGYITEKIINAMLAKAIPIYWGAPDVVQHFNPHSFICVSSFLNRNKLLEFI